MHVAARPVATLAPTTLTESVSRALPSPHRDHAKVIREPATGEPLRRRPQGPDDLARFLPTVLREHRGDPLLAEQLRRREVTGQRLDGVLERRAARLEQAVG